MSSSRFHAESEYNPRIRLLKTIGGLVIILVLTFLYLAVSFNQPGFSQTETVAAREPAGTYVSAVYGVLLVDEGEGEERVLAGDSLQVGRLYKLNSGNAAYLRFAREDMDVLISGKALFAVGTSLDPARLKVLEGELVVNVNAREEVSIPLEVSHLRLIPRSAGRFHYTEGRRPQLTVLEGQVRVVGESIDRVFTPGNRLTFVEGGAELEEFAVLPEPEPLSPASGTLFRKSSDGALTLDFIWEEVASAETYLFQLSPNILFIDNVFERRSSQPRISLADLSEGMYYWRVTALEPGTGATSPPSSAVPFSVVTMATTDEEAVSAPDLELTEVTTQSRLISIRGKTEPGARVRIRLESFGRIIMEPKEILVQSTGDFVTLVEAPVSGQFEVFVEAFYRPEFVTTQKTTVDVDF